MSSAGHVMDMINRMKQNRALKNSQKNKYGTGKRLLLKKNHIKLLFKKVSKEQEEIAIKKIRRNYRNFAKKEILIFSTILIILTIVVLYFLNIVNFQ